MPISRCRFTAGLPKVARRSTFLLLSGLLSVAALPTATVAQNAPIERTAAGDPYAAIIAEASRRFGIPKTWIRAVMRAESHSDVRAISPAGAMGLMQIMPDTWADLRLRHRLGGDPYSPRDNILAGTAYLREMHDRYGSPGFLAAYNAGPGRYEEYLAGRRALPAETRAYVAALAPLVGGGKIDRPFVVAGAVERNNWTRAPLFAPQSDHTPAVDPAPRDGQPDDAPAATPVHDLSAISPLSDGLFIVHLGSGDPQ
ncbi:lytic transglycosylase domain-containing protein [Mesorhizobium sp. M7A.F.Ca.US.006.01.1.1]|uniref:lytic transglycosylase domain-containing protein n=1 Tax=Mesorhizobium sp. M7A.F.Ca.US.006.01.1.1 TaxID=2496707 RepID=UPI000FCAAD4D|nr:lytic transglycosylase domain-containing protein [Mesorhizobium sp. M7A.F.Ca.US.006.01.1.1]RUZ78241.1 lytic transglycosylase domain-containing protein [Mesorhizobium sp. M7A.F.Ca.US.006.01.1.1]